MASNQTTKNLSKNTTISLSIIDFLTIAGFLISIGVTLAVMNFTKDKVEDLENQVEDYNKNYSDLKVYQAKVEALEKNIDYYLKKSPNE